MSDLRPSENQDETPTFPMAKSLGIIPEAVAKGYIKPAVDPGTERMDPTADFIERATNAHDPALGLVFAQLATVEQLRKLTTAVEAAAESVRELIEAGEPR